MFKDKKIAVVGGAGFIGSNLVDALVSEGASVLVIDNLYAGKKENINPKVEFVLLDIADLETLEKNFQGMDFVFHLAAMPRVQHSIAYPIESNNANIGGTLNVLVAAKNAKVKRVIYSASSSAYGDQTIFPLTEDLPANPKSPYGVQKYVGELYARVFNQVYELETVSLRYFNVYGPRQDGEGDYAGVVSKFLRQKKNGEKLTILGDGEQTRDFTHVSDVVTANILAATSDKVGAGEVINVGAGHNISIKKLASIIGGEVEYAPARFEPKDSRASNKLAKELLGWEAKVSVEEGIKSLKNYLGIE